MARKKKPIKLSRWLWLSDENSLRHAPKKEVHVEVWQGSSTKWEWALVTLDRFDCPQDSRGTSATERGAKIAATKRLKKYLRDGE